MKDKSNTIKLILDEIEEQGILEALGDGISIQDTNYRVVYQNQIHKSFVGEHTGEFCYKAYEKKEQVCDGCPLAMAFKDGKTHTEERSAPTNRGIAYFDITASPLKDLTGKIIAGIEIARDITEKKRAEEAVRESEGKFRTIVKNSEPIIFMLDKEGVFLVSEGKSLSVLGLKPGQVVGMSALEMYKDNPVILNSIKVALNGKISNFIAEVQGAVFDTFMSPYKNANNDVIGVIGMAVDITKLRETDAALKVRMQELEEFFDMSIGRENKMAELKHKIKQLESELSDYKSSKE